MTKFVEILQVYDDFVSLDKKACATEIENAEKQLGLFFSEEYREYTGRFGAASADGHEFTGVVDISRLSVVQSTNYERERNLNIPSNLYVIEKLGIDGIIIWQDQNGLIYKTVGQGNVDVIARNLVEYME